MKVTSLSSKLITPSCRSGHRFVSLGDDLILFGGYTQNREPPRGVLKTEVWCFHVPTEQWSLLQTNPHDFPTSTASCAVVAIGRKLVVFGGSGTSFGHSNSDKFMMLDVETLQWEDVPLKGDRIEAGYGHSIVVGPDDALYLYGGSDGYHFFNCIHRLEMGTWRNTSYYREGHEGRYRCEAVEHDGKVYIFGGGAPAPLEPLDYLPHFDIATRRWGSTKTRSSSFPCARVAHSCNKTREYVVLIGGQTFTENRSVALSDLWLLRLSDMSWIQPRLNLPRGMFFHSGAFATNDTLYTFGGCILKDEGDSLTPKVERISDTFKVEIFLPSLVELSWAVFRRQHPGVGTSVLVELGVPGYLAERVRTLVSYYQ